MLFSKKVLGIDIGISSIKIIELSGGKKKQTLEHCGVIESTQFFDESSNLAKEGILSLSPKEIAKTLSSGLKELGIRSKEAVFSIADFLTFFANITLPPMKEEEISQAVRYQSRKVIPLSLKETTLDWQIIEGKPSTKDELKILVVAISNEVIKKYQSIANLAKLNLLGIEPEAFSLARSLVKEEKGVAIIDIGAQSTTCNIIENKTLKTSYSLNISSKSFVQRISKRLNISYDEALELEKKYGIKEKVGGEGRIAYESLIPSIKFLSQQIENVFEEFSQMEDGRIEKIILAGGAALLPGLKEFLEDFFKKEVEIANPFFGISYPSSVEQELIKVAPIFGVATGLAKRNFL